MNINIINITILYQVVTLANEEDMYNMFDMFEIGQMAILLTTDDVFIRTRSKWRQVLIILR